MMYCDIQTEPLDKDWLLGFSDELTNQDWLCIEPFEDEWEVVKGFIDEASEGKGDMYGLEKLCKEFPYVPMAVDKKTGITVGVYPTDYNPRLTNIFHVLYRLKQKSLMKTNQSQDSYCNNNERYVVNNGGFTNNPPLTNYNMVSNMGTQSTNYENQNIVNKEPEVGDIAVLRKAYHEKDEPPKFIEKNITGLMVKSKDEEQNEGYAFHNGTSENIELVTEPKDRNWHPNKNQFGQYNTPMQQGVNPYMYNPNNNSFGGSTSYVSGYRGTSGNGYPFMKFSCFNDVYPMKEAYDARNRQEAMMINRQAMVQNPTGLETGYTDFSNPESVAQMQNPYGYLNQYNNPNLRGGNPYQQPYAQPRYSYGPSPMGNAFGGNYYNSSSLPSYSIYYNDGSDYMIATDEEVESGYGIRPYVSKHTDSNDNDTVECSHEDYYDKITSVQFKVKVTRTREDGTIEDTKGNELDPYTLEPIESKDIENKKEEEVNYDVQSSSNDSSVQFNFGLNKKSNPKDLVKVTPALERETEDLCEQLCVYDDAMAITLFNSLRSGRYTYDEFYVFRDWCREKLAWYRYQERIHPENDYRLDYRYRPDPFTIRAFGKVMVDMHKPNLDIQPKKYDRDGKRIYTFDRGHDITDEEMDIFLMRAEMQRDVIIRDGLAKKSYDYAVQLLDEENYNPFDPVSVRIHDIKVKQRQQKDQYKFYKRAYRNLMSESQFDNWWFGYDNNPKVQLTPLQQRIRYVDRMTEMNMEMLRTNLVPIDYVARAKAYNDAIEKSFREFDEGYIKKEDSLADCFDKLSYLMVRVNDLELEEQRKNRMVKNRMNDYSGYRSTLGSFDRRNNMDQFLYNQYGQGYTQYSTTGYKIDQKPIEFTNSANYLNQSSKFKDYCHMNKGNRQLNPIAN